MLKQFTIDENFITNVIARSDYSLLNDPANPTEEDFIKILKGQGCVMLENKDHEEFAKLRNQLEELGYIKTMRTMWNGDVVLKSFKLNNWIFKKGRKFPSASALKCVITWARKNGYKSISIF